MTGHDSSRVAPFGNPRITVRLPTTRGLSQASTSFIGSWCQGIHRVPLKTWPQRCSRSLCSSQDPGDPRTVFHACTRSGVVRGGPGPLRIRRQPVPQDPTACQAHTRLRCVPSRRSTSSPRAGMSQIDDPPMSRPIGAYARCGPWTHDVRQSLLRKEVIQPHLPVRLPCYDFVPIASPTFDGSLLAVGPPASGVTDFRDVTGGVYKARERIHRSVADLRLLATPTS